MEDSQNSVIYVYAGTNDNGVVQEELLAKELEKNIYQLISSPGLALNLAKGKQTGDRPRLIKWSGMASMPMQRRSAK